MKIHYLVPSICQVIEIREDHQSQFHALLRKKKIEKHTIQIQNNEYLRICELNITQWRNGTNHNWYLRNQGQRYPDYTLEGTQYRPGHGEIVRVSPVGKAISIYQLNFYVAGAQ